MRNNDLDSGISGEDPKHHGDPVEDDHQEDPVGVHRRVQDQNQHPEKKGLFDMCCVYILRKYL